MEDMNKMNSRDGSTYASKMDEAVTKAMQGWWKSLTKEELLQYLLEQPKVTADDIRNMMANMDCVLAFDIRYSTNKNDAATDFHAQS